MQDKLIPIILISNTLITLMITGILYFKKKRHLYQCQKSTGVIIQIDKKTGSEGDTFHPLIEYTNLEGVLNTFLSHYGSSHLKSGVGDEVEIYISSDSSKEPELVGFMTQWGIVSFFGLGSVMSAVASIVLW